MFNRLKHKFAELTSPPPIVFEYRSLAEDRKDWEEKSVPSLEELREHMGFFITGEYSQPWGYIFRNTDLSGLDLTGLEDSRRMVSKEDAEHLLIGGSIFEDVSMRELRIINGKFFGSQFERCDFTQAQLTGANFSSNTAYGFMFMYNPFGQKYQFGETVLKDIKFNEAELRNAVFAGAKLENIDFSYADLRGADFTGVDVSNCDFTGAKIDGAVFSGQMIKPHQLYTTLGTPIMKSGLGPAQMLQLRRMRHNTP